MERNARNILTACGAQKQPASGKITAAQLVAYFQRACREQWGYVWSLNGELYTQAMADRFKANKRSMSQWRDPETYWTVDCKKWIGRMAADCSGGIIGAMRTYHPSYGDRTANTLYTECSAKGTIARIPETPGLCVWKEGHIGVYEGNGYVLEFRGTEYGCVRTRLSQRNFTHWGYLRDVDYGDGKEEPVAKVLRVTSPMMRGEEIRALQAALNALGYPCGDADGVCGQKTMAGVMAFCEAHLMQTELPEALAVTVNVAGKEYKGEIGG